MTDHEIPSSLCVDLSFSSRTGCDWQYTLITYFDFFRYLIAGEVFSALGDVVVVEMQRSLIIRQILPYNERQGNHRWLEVCPPPAASSNVRIIVSTTLLCLYVATLENFHCHDPGDAVNHQCYSGGKGH